MSNSIFELNSADDSFTISKKKQSNHAMPYSHFHSSYEAYYILSGEREFFLKDRTIVIKEGDLIILQPNVLHRTNDSDHPEHEIIILNFKKSSYLHYKETFLRHYILFFKKTIW